MRRTLLLAGLVLFLGVLFAACAEKEPTGPEDASFKKQTPTECLDEDQQDLKEDIDLEIEELFAERKSKRGAHEIVNNMVRKLCKEQYDDATNMAWDFFYLVWRQMPDKLTGGPEEAAALTQMVFTFASDPLGDPPLEIPDGAFEESGGVIRFDPTTATPENPIIAATTNGQAAVVIDNPNAFPPGTDMVTIALSRESDDVVTEPGEFITGFQAYPIGIQILSDAQPDPNGGGLLIALCVLDGAPADVVIGHLHNGDVGLHRLYGGDGEHGTRAGVGGDADVAPGGEPYGPAGGEAAGAEAAERGDVRGPWTGRTDEQAQHRRRSRADHRHRRDRAAVGRHRRGDVDER